MPWRALSRATTRQYDFAVAHQANKVLAGRPVDVAEQLATVREWLGSDITVSCVLAVAVVANSSRLIRYQLPRDDV